MDTAIQAHAGPRIPARPMKEVGSPEMNTRPYPVLTGGRGGKKMKQ